ncbi:hypothetical protein [Dongia sp.]|uniref:hypothetical protein n=1 Tax=Dongia sp. TaxID=1977262 RepID=UPI0035AF6BB4
MSNGTRFTLGNILKFGLVLGIALGTAPAAKAGIAIVNLSSAQFVSNCQRMGGTLSRPEAGGLSCKLPSGTVVSCSFNGDGSAFCNWTSRLAAIESRDLLGSKLESQTGQPPKVAVPDSNTLN